jgi:GTP-binding protein
LLIDSRHGIKANDEEIMDILDESAVVYQILLTKIDKIPQYSDIAKKIESQICKHVAAFPNVIPTSSEKKWGIQNVQTEIISLIDCFRDNAKKV